MLLGILAFPGMCCCYSSIPLGILAIITGMRALHRANASVPPQAGRRTAMVGIVFGAFAIVITLGMFLMTMGVQLMQRLHSS